MFCSEPLHEIPQCAFAHVLLWVRLTGLKHVLYTRIDRGFESAFSRHHSKKTDYKAVAAKLGSSENPALLYCR